MCIAQVREPSYDAAVCFSLKYLQALQNGGILIPQYKASPSAGLPGITTEIM